MRSYSLRVALACGAAITVACTATVERELLDPESDNWDERRRRMDVMVQESQNTSLEWGPLVSKTPDELLETLGDYCAALVRESGTNFADCTFADLTNPQSCDDYVCATQVGTCMSLTALELSRAASTVELRWGLSPERGLRVPPQSTASIAGLAEMAIMPAMYATVYAGENLRYAVGDTSAQGLCTETELTNGFITPKDGEPQMYAEALAGILIEASHIVEEAGLDAARANAAVADSDRSRERNAAYGSRMAWTAPVLSRLHGAQLLIGGYGHDGNPATIYNPTPVRGDHPTAGLYPDPATHGVCGTVQCTSAACRRAEGMLRDTGIGMDLVADVPRFTVDDFGNSTWQSGVSAEDLFESVGQGRDRLSERYRQTNWNGTPTSDFFARMQVSPTDIDEARTHMAAEAAAFDRDSTTQAAPPVLTGGAPAAFTYWAATASAPTQHASAFYVAGARALGAAADQRSVDDDYVIPNAQYALDSVANTIDYANTVGMHVVRHLGPANWPQLSDYLGVLVLRARGGDSGRLEVCYRNDPYYDHFARVRIYGGEDEARFRVVAGTSGLSCATEARVEGETCRIADYTVEPIETKLTTEVDERLGYDSHVDIVVPVPTSIQQRYYVVRLRRGAPNQAAGNYEALGEVSVPSRSSTTSTDWAFCHATPIEPTINEAAGGTLATDPEACGAPANDCFGAPLTGELPLESELIDDGDAFENSWRYHLNVARREAEAADELGEQLIASGLEMDRRAEGALEELERICGAGLGLDGLFGPSGAGFGSTLDRIIDGACSAGTCQPGYSCLGTVCVLDPVAAASAGPADAQRLAECLGQGDTIVPVVGLGTGRLCYWRDADSANVICAPGARSCPWEPEDGEPCGTDGAPPNTVVEEVSDTLGIFETGAATGAEIVEPLQDCSLIRRIRNEDDPRIRGGLVDDLRRTNFFAIENVRDWAERIGWSAYPLDFSMLTVDGAPWYGTGIPFSSMSDDPGDSGYWPCSAEAFRDEGTVQWPTSPCAYGADSLFCATATSCTSAADRAAFNDRLGRAALALAITSGVGVAHFQLPMARDPMEWPSVFDIASLQGGRIESDWRAPSSTWRLGSSGRWTAGHHSVPELDLSGLYAFPLAAAGPVWRGLNSTAVEPVAFVRMGTLAPEDARSHSEVIWSGMSEGAGMWIEDDPIADCLGGSGELISRALRRTDDRLEITSDAACDNALSQRLSSYWIEPYGYWDWSDSGTGPLRHYRNTAMLADEGLRTRDIVDSLELMCEAARYGTEVYNCDAENPPEVRSSGDIPQLRAYLDCLANRLEQAGERMVIQNVPQRVVDAIQGDPAAQISEGGAYGNTIIRLRDNLRLMERLPRSIASQVHQFADDLKLFQIALAQIEAQRELTELRSMSEVFGQTAACVSASGSNNVAGAVATCANSLAQIAIQFRIGDITESMLTGQAQTDFIEFRGRWEARQLLMQDLAGDILHAAEGIHADLAALDNDRRSANRNLAYALFADSDQAGRHFEVNTTMRRVYNTRLERYRRAHRAAVQMAVLARRALEQRLGVHLEDFAEEMRFVDAPASWVGSVCESTGIDYARIRDATELPSDSFADAYVGDYVDRLERFFESYRHDFPHTDGADTAVVSLRDDVQNVRRECLAHVHNELALSNDLDQAVVPVYTDLTPEEHGAGWSASGCTPLSGGSISSCVHAVEMGSGPASVPLLAAGNAPVLGLSESHVPMGYRVVFAAGTDGSVANPADVSWTPQTELQQPVQLTAGMYRLSFFAHQDAMPGPGALDPLATVRLVSDGTDPATINESDGLVVGHGETNGGALASGWTHYVRHYRVPVGGGARVRVFSGQVGNPTQTFVDLAGVQLERSAATSFPTQLDLDGHPGVYAPRAFAATVVAGRAKLSACEDTTGSLFRGNWAYYCSRLCDSGFASCPATDTQNFGCYWQTEFSLSRDAMESGSQLGGAGVALGNFNYRFDTVGVNFVGTGARTCADSDLPSTCHSAGWIQYSIEHLPPFTVQTYDGAPYEAELFVGNIGRARGLAAERYITNPISSADRSLMADYMRRELRGRPLSGRFIVRVWDTPDVNFSGIEDVQLVLNYRYFTRTPRPPPAE